MSINRVSYKKFKKAAENLSSLCVFFTHHKNDLDAVLIYRNINKLSLNYYLFFHYLLHYHLKYYIVKKN
jgi:hypothetical protein